ncbi:aspartic proteinase [Stachybotrys elegans]|uniref:Aspartic proteinase n=1 Tax=Stachybotrys elegans TaxID=80388 RepID=A0A8K0WZ24_9HYPO|nr:aspartic proteinase [Stachybotrys elegans]
MKSAFAAVVAAHLAGVNAAPIETSDASESSATSSASTFSLGQIQNDAFAPIDGPSAMIRAHMKYAGKLPDSLTNAIEINPTLNERFHMFLPQEEDKQTGSAVAYPAPWYDTEYVVPVKIGTPPQVTYLNLDTGSSDFWAFTTDTYQPTVFGQVLYDPEASNTSHRLNGQSWSIRYGDGAYAAGIVYKDRVRVGGASVDDQAVQSAIQVSSSISQDSFSSGIIGMARTNGNTVRPDPQKTFLENVLPSLEDRVFTSNLQKGRPGNYDFGYINKTQYTGDIHYLDARKNSTFWHIDVPGYQVGKNGTQQNTTWNSIVDTGTTLLLVPSSIVNAYYTQVSGAGWDMFTGMIIFPCESDLPDFYFTIGPHKGRVPGSYINYGNVDPTYCFGGIQSSEGIPFAVMGDVLLKAQFVVFDSGENRVGFANKPVVE